MKYAIALIALTLSLTVNAETYHNANGDVITKLEAMKSLIQKPDAKIVKCQEVIMSDKGTIKNKPKASVQ